MYATISMLSHIKVESAEELARIEHMRVDEIATIASRGQDIRIECKIVADGGIAKSSAVAMVADAAPSTDVEDVKPEARKKK